MQSKLYEKIGRLQIVIEQQDAAYSSLINVLGALVAGKIKLDDIAVNLTDRTWEITVPPPAAQP